MQIVAMLVCNSTQHDTNNPEQGNVYLSAVTQDNPYGEYFAFTPSANLNMGILNKSAFLQFEPGKTYKMTLEKGVFEIYC